MTDIIRKLRDGAIQARLAIVEGMTPEGIALMGEAADEIERLRAVLFDISNNEYAGYGGIGGIARSALRSHQQSTNKEG